MNENRFSFILATISIVQTTALIVLIVMIVTRTSSEQTPADVYKLAEENFQKLLAIEELVEVEGAVVVAVPDRWTKTDHNKWEAEFFKANPGLVRPEAETD